MELSPKCRNFVLDGLTHLVEVCIRLNKHEKAKEICEKIITQLPPDYHKPFLFKIGKVEAINKEEDDDEKQLVDYRKPKNETIMGMKLKEALNKK